MDRSTSCQQDEVSNTQAIGRYGAVQSVAEVGLGSFVHSIRVPFSGHLMSLNQGLILTLAIRKEAPRFRRRKEAISLASGISNVAALLKILSPSGARVSPMLAISAQGFLYSLGLGIAGVNRIGVMVAMILLSVFAIVQSFIMTWIILGSSFFEAIYSIWLKTAALLHISPQYGIWILAGLVLLKFAIAIIIAELAWKSHPNFEERYFQLLNKHANNRVHRPLKSKPNDRPFWGAFRDLLNPWLLCSLTLTTVFLYFSGSKTPSMVVIYLLRVLAVSWIIFWGIRSIPKSWLDQKLQNHPALQYAADQVFRLTSRH